MKRLVVALAVVVASLASYRPLLPGSPLVCTCAPGSSALCFVKCPAEMTAPEETWGPLWLHGFYFFDDYVRAAELDPRAEMTIQATPMECLGIWGRLQDVKAENDAQSDASAAVRKTCGFEAIEAKIKGAKKDPKGNPILADADFSGPRIARKIPRDALVMLLDWIAPTSTRPVPLAADATLRPLRLEFREVLAGRDPYARAKP